MEALHLFQEKLAVRLFIYTLSRPEREEPLKVCNASPGYYPGYLADTSTRIVTLFPSFFPEYTLIIPAIPGHARVIYKYSFNLSYLR